MGLVAIETEKTKQGICKILSLTEKGGKLIEIVEKEKTAV
jgi:DNA-binding MarR family transcriptional regulator